MRFAKSGTREKEIAILRQYTDPTAHFRMVREEIATAAKDGKTKLQFPTGETAMKVEGLGVETHNWSVRRAEQYGWHRANPDDLKIGMDIREDTG